MKFKQQSSFNSCDTSARTVKGRKVVEHGVKQRCELVLRAVGYLKSGNLKLIMERIHDEKKEHVSYTPTDILYVCRRLVREGVMNCEGGEYSFSPRAMKKWEALPKDMI